MIATQIRIHNFRTYIDCSISLYPYGLLVGRNNCGKSNLIDAIRVFYEDLKFDPDRDYPKSGTDDEEVWLEVQYHPSLDELESLKDEYKQEDGSFRVRKYLQSKEKDSEGKNRSGIYAYIGGGLSSSRFYGAKNVQQGKLGDIIHIPPVSTIGDSTKMTGPSPLRDLLGVVLNKIFDKSKAYTELKNAFDAFEGQIMAEVTDDGLSLNAIQDEITEGIRDWDLEFNLHINPLDQQTMTKYLVGHSMRDNLLDQEMSPDRYGQGFQRHFIFTLIRIAAKYSTDKAPNSKSEFSPSLIWLLYEEPEAFLHPSQIDVLDTSLRDLSKGEGTQILITTHNPQFVSRNIDDLPSLVKLRKEFTTTTVGQLSKQDVVELFHENQEEVQRWIEAGEDVNPDDLTEDMEAAKHALWLNPLRCSSFFADFVILVEGPTESALIPRFIADGMISRTPAGTFIMDCLGKFNLHRFMNLFSRLGIRHSVLFDHDDGKYPYVEETIHNARSEHTFAIVSFPRDIETFLGIPYAGSPHRKPQHVMYYYRNGLIEEINIETFVAKIKALLPKPA